MPQDSSALRAAFGQRLLHLGRLWRQTVDAEIQKDTFPDAGWRALLWLHRSGEDLRQKDLAAVMGIEGPSLVRLLDSLSAAGLLLRTEDGTDRRARRLTLTAEGRKVVLRIEARLAAVEAALLEGIPDAELAACSDLLARLEPRLLAGRAAR